MSYHCPTCQRLLYDRGRLTCGFCEAPVPAELRFTAEELAEVERRRDALELARQVRLIAREEAERAARGATYYYGGM